MDRYALQAAVRIASAFAAQSLSIVLLGACSIMQPTADLPVTAPPSVRAVAPSNGLALVLSGGSARAFAHVGVIAVLEEAGVRPTIVVASSAGSIVGALYAAGLDPDALRQAAREANWNMVNDWQIQWKMLGVVRGEHIETFVNRHVQQRKFAALPKRLAVIATDMQTGALTPFNEGDIGRAVRASCAVPAMFVPVEIAGRLYVDGSLSSPLPVSTALAMGATMVIAVDVGYPPEHAKVGNPIDVLLQTGLIQTHRLRALEARNADVVIAPDLPPTNGQYSFADRDMLIAAGERAARVALPRIRALLAQRQRQVDLQTQSDTP